MDRVARPTLWAAVLLLLLALVACGKDKPNQSAADARGSELPALLGVYRSPSGAEIEFEADGRFRSSVGSGGRFTLDGDKITLTLSTGQTRTGERLGPDVLRLDGPSSSLKFFRVGSAAAQSPEATTTPPRRTPAEPPKPLPDPSVPLSQYVPVTSAADLRWLFAARQPALTDEDKLVLLGGPAPADAFARRDFIAQRWPAIESRLAAFKTSYVRLDLSRGRQSTEAPADGAMPLLWISPLSQTGIELQPYDLDRHQFRFEETRCLGATSVSGQDMQILRLQASSGPSGLCALRVADEAQARAIEAARAQRPGGFPIGLQVYAFLQSEEAGLGQAVITHATLRLYSDGTSTEPLATIDLL
jgi:hypothetical protein